MYQKGSINNEERRARLAGLVLYLFPNIMQCYVLHYIYKQGLSNKYCNNKRNPPVLTPTELLLITELPKVKNFTVQLCYKLISFEGLLPTPRYGWGKLPHFKALTIADDIERIRHKINAIIELHNDVFTEVYLVKFLYQLEQIIHRLQIAKEDKSVNPVYKYLLIKQIDTAVVLTELKNVSVIDSDVQRIKLQDRERYSKISAVITEFFPKLLRIMIPSNLTPLALYNFCTLPGNKWDILQQSQIQTLQSGQNYESLDATLLYKIFRRFNFVPAPTRTWGKEPKHTDLTIADDIERIRILRNKTAHRCDTCIDQTDFDDYFLQFREITHRIAVDYEHELIAIQECSLDPKRQYELENALQQLEDMKERFKKSPVKYYWGNDFERKIKEIRQKIQTGQDILGQDKVFIEIELPDIDDTETRAKILNKFTKEINEGDVKIEFIRAFTGSLVLHAYIRSETFTTDETLQTELASFMTRVLKKRKFGIASFQWIDAVLVPTEGDKNPSIGKSLKLQFNINMDAFKTDALLESEIGSCMQRSIKNLNGKGFDEEVTAIIGSVQSDVADTEEIHEKETSILNQDDKICAIEKGTDVSFTFAKAVADTEETHVIETSILNQDDLICNIEIEVTDVSFPFEKAEEDTEVTHDMKTWQMGLGFEIMEIEKEATNVSGIVKRVLPDRACKQRGKKPLKRSLTAEILNKEDEFQRKVSRTTERFKKSHVKYYRGNYFERKIVELRQKIQTGKVLLGKKTIIIDIELPDIDDTETKAEILNNFREEINEGDVKIEFTSAFAETVADTEESHEIGTGKLISDDKICEIEESTDVSFTFAKGEILPSQKHISFTHTPMTQKPIAAIPGIGTKTKSIFAAIGFTKAIDLLRIFEKSDEERFKDFLSKFGMNKGQQNNTYNALKDWVKRNPQKLVSNE